MKKHIYYQLFSIILVLAFPGILFSQNCTVNAGLDQTICAASALTLYGTDAGLLTGGTTWTQVSGPSVIITSPHSLNTTVTGYTGGNTYKFWLNASCVDGSLIHDECVVTVLGYTIANAGADQTLCPGTGALSANAPGVNETGLWTSVWTNNGIVVMNPNSPTSAINVSPSNSGETTLRWTIANSNGCASYDDVVITDLGGIGPVSAGPDITISTCYSTTTSTTLAASFGGNGNGQSGLWTVVSGPNIPTITVPTSRNSTVTNLIQGTYTLRWTVTGTCVNGSDDMNIFVPPATQSLTGLNDASTQTFCDSRTTATLTQKTPEFSGENGIWSFVSGPAGSVIVSPNSPTTIVTGLNGAAGSTYVFKYTVSNTYGCSASANSTITFVAPATAINAGPDQILPCGVSTVTLPYTFTGGNLTQFRIVNGPAGSSYINYPTQFSTTGTNPLVINGLFEQGTYEIELSRSVSGATNSCPPALDQVNVTTSYAPSGSTSGTKQVLACNVVSTALAGNIPTSGLGTWYQSSGPNTAVLANPHAYNSGISSLIPGVYVFRWLISGGPYCPTYQDDVSVVVANAQPSAANAGPDQTVCYGAPIPLSANIPALNENGKWAVSPSAGVTISNVNSPFAIVTFPNPSTTYTLTWTITNACGISSDNVQITTTSTNGPIQTVAGPDQCLAAGTTTITLSGNNPSPGTGVWTKLTGGPATITNPASQSSTVTGMTDGSYTFEWAVTRGIGCIVSRDTVMITISGPVTTANAGADQTVCGNSVTLAGNIASTGSGTWSLISGPAGSVIVSPNSPNTSVTGLTGGVYTFRWTISNGNASCPVSKDDVVIYVSTPPPAANAGADKSVCGGSSVTLSGVAPAFGTGLWTVVSGPNVPDITPVNSPTATVTSLMAGTYTLRWSVTSGPFCPPSTDDMIITVVPSASTSGNTTTYCGATSIPLTGNTGSTGIWTQSGTTPSVATITTTGPNTAIASGLVPGVYTFTYTLPVTGSCAQTSANLTVSISASGTSAVAGADQSVCRSGSSVTVTFAANTPVAGTGTWTKISGPSGGTTFLPNASAPNASVSLTNSGTYVYGWTVTNGICSTQDQTTIYVDMPSLANAGSPQTICGTSTTLAATPVPPLKVGNWTQDSGPNTATFSSTILSNPVVSNLVTGTYVFRWTVTGGTCTPTTSSSTVTINVSQSPSTPDAGPDQTFCGASTVTMNANAIVNGTGIWTQVGSAPIAVIANPADPNSSIALTGGTGTYTFQWTASNGTCSLSDQVVINNNAPPPTANAGNDQSLCQYATLTLSANSPAPGTGLWSFISGPTTPTIISPTSNITQVIGIDAGGYTFRWTTSTQDCSSSSDDVIITINPSSTIAVAGPDQTSALPCGHNTVTLAGNSPAVGTGQWSVVNGTGGSFANANLYNTAFTGIPGSTYLLRWTIANGSCSSSDDMNVVLPSILSATKTQTDVMCNGQQTGSITVTGFGGSTPYQYALNNGQYSLSGTFRELAAGTYTVYVKDANGCVDSETIIINQPSSPLSGSITAEGNVLCTGQNNGFVSVQGNGGVPPYQYAFDDGDYGPSGTFTNLIAGFYIVHVKDANDCDFNQFVYITEPPVLSSYVTQLDIFCFGQNTGFITVEGRGGTTPYQYQLNDGVFGPSGTFNDLAAGIYTVHMKDANGCTLDQDFELIQPPTSVADSISSQTNVLCFGQNTGGFTIAGTGGSEPYQYALDNGGYDLSDTFTGLAAGSYTAHVQDANGCLYDQAIVITQPPVLSATITKTDVLCYGQNTGIITIAGSGGVGPYQYAFEGGEFVPSGTFSNLAAGSYTLHLRDVNGCVLDQAVTIAQPASSVSASVSSQSNIQCYGQNSGIITIAGNGGVAPYQFALDAGQYRSSGTFSGLASGSYTIHVKDANGCIAEQGVVITQPDNAVSASITSQVNIICFGQHTGSITVAGSGGTSPYQYAMENGIYGSSGIFTGLAAGSYTIHVKDANGCVFDQAVVISQPASAVSASITTLVNVLCFGQNTGVVTIDGSGGIAPYVYALGSGSFTSSGIFSGLTAGSYTIHVKDANGCLYDQVVAITQPATSVSSTSSQINVLCFGQNTGSVTVTGNGGTNPYQYAMDNGQYAPSGTFSGLTAGSYTVHVNDANGCIYDQPVTITQPATAVSGSITAQLNVVVNGQSTGSVTVAGSGGVLPYTYALGGGSYSSSGTFTGLPAGNYTVHVKDANGCIYDQPVFITQPSTSLSASVISQINVLCMNQSTGSFTVTGIGGVAPYQYALGTGSYSSSGTFSGLPAGSYTVHVKDANGTVYDKVVTITQPATAVTATITAQTNVLCYGMSTGSVTVAGSGGVSPYQYTIEKGVKCSSSTFSGLAADSYIVHVKDANGCVYDLQVTITQPPSAVSASITSQSNVLCFGQSTGSVTVAGNGGVAPYKYALGSGSYVTSGTFSNLKSGNFTVHVKDANGCISDQAVTITQPVNAVSASIVSQSNVMCYGQSTGSVTVSGSGGVAPYKYALGTGIYDTVSTFVGLAKGCYTIHVKDANGCSYDKPVTITQPANAVSASVTSQTNVLCKDQSTGSVTVAGSGGVGPYQYAMGNGSYSSSGTFTGLAAGPSTIHVKDVNGCVYDKVVTITQPANAVSASITAQTNVLCYGQSSGSITVAGSGGVSPYQYTLDGAKCSSSTFTGLAAGAYTIHVKDANGCTFDLQATITQPATSVSSFIVSQSNVLCFGQSTASVTVAGNGGVAPYKYALGSGSYLTSGTFNYLKTGNYTIHVKDANGCITDQAVIITQPVNAVSASITSQSNVLCYGQSTGSITVAGSGGVAPYQYALGTGTYDTVSTFSGLAKGCYTIHVKDANGCSYDKAVTITQPINAVSASVTSQTNVLCKDQNTGSVTVAGSGGVAPYQYALGTGSFGSSGTFTGLAAGTVTVHVKDANGCIYDKNITIIQPANAVSALITAQTNVMCYGQSSGSVTVAGSGGVSPYQYTLDGAKCSSSTFTGLAADTYTIHVKDANGCTFDLPVTITQPANAVSASITSQSNVLCFGQSTGSVTIIGNGGLAPYKYALGAGSYCTSGTFINLKTGSYTIHVKDANGCIVDQPVTITQPVNAVAATITSQSNVLCYGQSNGSVTISGSGGVAPYKYALGTGTYDTVSTFSGLAKGCYTIHVKDANGCSYDKAITITQPASAVYASVISQTNVLCKDQNTGSVTVAGSGGVAPYQYAMGNGSYSSSGTFTGLPAGPNTIHVKDANGCTYDKVVTITQPANAVSATITAQTNVLCYGQSSGSVTVAGSGGVSPYQYTMDAAKCSSSTFTGLAADTYTIHVKDANGCTFDLPVTITQPANAVSASITSQSNVLCYGQSTGTVTVAGNGGVAPYQYALGCGSYGTSGTFGTLKTGTYTIHVKDANGCIFDQVVTITQPTNAVSATITSQTNVLCYGQNNGSVTVAGNGGVAPYQYALGNGTYGTSGTFTGLPVGTSTIHVKDANGCSYDKVVTITQPSNAVSASVTSQTNILCYGQSSGSVTIAGSGGVAPYQYALGTGSFGSSGTFTGLPAGPSTIHVKDANGCIYDKVVTITQPATAVSATITAQTNVLCYGQSTGSVTVTGSGGVSPYLYTIEGGAKCSSNTFTGLAAGSYTVHVKDANGCMFNQLVTITQPATPVSVAITSQNNVQCYGQSSGSVTVAGNGGVAPYQYALGCGSYGASGTFNGLAAGNYTVHAKDANGCTTDQAVTITQPAVLAAAMTQTNVTCNGGNNGSATVTVSGGTAGYTYLWNTVPAKTTNAITGLTAGTYTVTVTDSKGCTATSSATITQPAAYTLSMSGSATVNTGTSNNYTATVTPCSGAITHSWTITGSGTISAGANLATVTVLAGASGSYTVTDNVIVNGCPNSISKTVTISVPPPCLILDPTILPFNYMTGNTISVDPTSVNASLVASYNWTLTGTGGWTKTAGSNGPTLTYTAGTGTGTVGLTVTYTNGVVLTCSKNITVQIASEYCTVTQGYWGNSGGNFCNTGSKVTLINSLLGSSGLTVGYGSNTMTFGSGGGQCIIDLLPGGGTSARISGVNTCSNHPGIQICSGKIKNDLLAQSITLALNMRLSANLSNMILDSPTLEVASSDGCLGYPQQAPNPYHPLAGTIVTNSFNASVFSLLQSIYGTSTPSVANLLDLANKALGNYTTVPPIPCNMLAPINDAVTMINEQFDGCNWGTFQGNGSMTRPVNINFDQQFASDTDARIDLLVVPNPLVTNGEIRFSVSKDTRATLDLYNYMGVKLSTLYDYRVTADDVNTYSFDGAGLGAGVYLVSLRTEYGSKIVRMIITH